MNGEKKPVRGVMSKWTQAVAQQREATSGAKVDVSTDVAEKIYVSVKAARLRTLSLEEVNKKIAAAEATKAHREKNPRR